jgi:hypothetical protein
MNATETLLITRLGIEPEAYIKIFRRVPHAISQLSDENEVYFGANERLNVAELTEVETWPNTVGELFEGHENADAKKHFLRCTRGTLKPQTSTETIVVKLIYQALAMGGLNCILGEDETANPMIPKRPLLNDVNELRAIPLRSFLLEVKKQMTNYSQEKWLGAISSKAHEENQAGDKIMEYELYQNEELDDLNEGRDEMMEIQAEIQDEISSYAEGLASSDEDGWFYDDED